jgi:hypothetical protein
VLRRPFQRQVDAVEQGLGAELGGLLPDRIGSGAVCRHLKIADRLACSRCFQITSQHWQTCNTSELTAPGSGLTYLIDESYEDQTPH